MVVTRRDSHGLWFVNPRTGEEQCAAETQTFEQPPAPEGYYPKSDDPATKGESGPNAKTDLHRRLCVNNLRLIEDCIDEVMAASNFMSTASVTLEQVGEYLKAGAVDRMNWPEGVQPPTEKDIQASGRHGLSVLYKGERVSTMR